MFKWLRFWRGTPMGASPSWGSAPTPQPGETVRLHTSDTEVVGSYLAAVRGVGTSRIFLDLEAGNLPGRVGVRIFFSRGDALYYFDTKTLAEARRGSVAVAVPRRIVRLQRRQYFRLPLETATTFRVVNDDGRISSGPVPARIVNLSGGGALVSVARPPIPVGVTVVLKVPAGRDGTILPVEARSLGCDVANRGAVRTYLARLQFTESALDTGDREEIIAFIHEQQRLMLGTRKLLRSG